MIEVSIPAAKVKRDFSVLFPESWDTRLYCTECYCIYDSLFTALCEECGSNSLKKAICRYVKEKKIFPVTKLWWNPFTWRGCKTQVVKGWKFRIPEKELFGGL